MNREEKFAEFVVAQNEVYASVRAELAAGKKQTHWIWFIFPQMIGLGYSSMSRKFGIASKAEAQRYVEHEVLGLRLRECTSLVLGLPHQNISSILGYPDDLKFRSCMTLFAAAVPSEPLFALALERFFEGKPDPRTLTLLKEAEDRVARSEND
jgi:uncharacterized protein (DUF1810 family)